MIKAKAANIKFSQRAHRTKIPVGPPSWHLKPNVILAKQTQFITIVVLGNNLRLELQLQRWAVMRRPESYHAITLNENLDSIDVNDKAKRVNLVRRGIPLFLEREVMTGTPYLGRLKCMLFNSSIQLNKLSFHSTNALKHLRRTNKSDKPKHRFPTSKK